MRSLLFVPADSPRKLEKALTSGADAIILDLEDSVAPAAKAEARAAIAEHAAKLRAMAQAPRLIVRINALDSEHCAADIDAVCAHSPYAIMLPKASGGADVQHLGAKLAVREAENGLADGAINILPIATEHAQAVLNLASYRGASRRLIALTWGAEDLSADIGAAANRDEQGAFTPPFALARNLMLFAAASAGVQAIDTVFTNFRDPAGLANECDHARRDGFTGKMAIHPDQVAIINSAFTPSRADIARAQAIVQAFADNPAGGVMAIDGRMIDRPHLIWAQRLLARAAQT